MSWKSLCLAAAGPLLLAGCASTDPQPAFDDVQRTVATRTTGHHMRWMRAEAERSQIERTVDSLLATNLTARSAVAIAILNNRSLQAEFEEIGISQAELSEASRLANPEFEGLWRVPNSGPGAVNAEYGLVQNLFDLLTLPARKQMAARHLEGTKLRIAHQVLALVEEVQAAYYTVQATEQLIERLKIIAEVNEAAADVAQRQHAAGNINDLELQHQQASYAQSRLGLAQAQAQLRADRERLNRLLGLWGAQTAWETAGGLPPMPHHDPGLEDVEAFAIRQRLDLAAARQEVLNLRSALQLQKRIRWIPGASLGFNAERELDGAWLLGPSLSLEVPIFDQGQPELAKLAAEYRRAARQWEALAIQIRSEVREARDLLIAARDVAEYHQNVLLPQRMRILRETLLHYNAMQLGNIALLMAKEEEQDEEQATIEALRDYWIARARLEAAVGGGLNADPHQPQTETKPSGSNPTKDSHHGHHH